MKSGSVTEWDDLLRCEGMVCEKKNTHTHSAYDQRPSCEAYRLPSRSVGQGPDRIGVLTSVSLFCTYGEVLCHCLEEYGLDILSHETHHTVLLSLMYISCFMSV